MIQGWASGRLGPSPRLSHHLDLCLGCRACEPVCPSLVAVGRLMDGAKAVRAQRLGAPRRALELGRLRLLSTPRATAVLARIAAWSGRWGLIRLAEAAGAGRIPGLAPLLRLAPIIPGTARSTTPRTPPHPDLELFVGCAGSLVQGHAIAAARALLEALGLVSRVADRARCCGALMRHNGFPAQADELRASWSRGPNDPPLVGLASACIAELREGAEDHQALELCHYLDRLGTLERLSFSPLRGRALVHEPCSHRHPLGDTAAVYRLLRHIPGLEVRPLEGNASCCGAAGTYFIDQPAMAERLLAPKVAALGRATPDYLVTTNPGCALHLAAGIRRTGLRVTVCHPVELLWKSAKGPIPGAGG